MRTWGGQQFGRLRRNHFLRCGLGGSCGGSPRQIWFSHPQKWVKFFFCGGVSGSNEPLSNTARLDPQEHWWMDLCEERGFYLWLIMETAGSLTGDRWWAEGSRPPCGERVKNCGGIFCRSVPKELHINMASPTQPASIDCKLPMANEHLPLVTGEELTSPVRACVCARVQRSMWCKPTGGGGVIRYMWRRWYRQGSRAWGPGAGSGGGLKRRGNLATMWR